MKITELLLAELNREAVGTVKRWNASRKERTTGSRMRSPCPSVIWQRLSPPFRRGSTWL
jgi:hypothetical protein